MDSMKFLFILLFIAMPLFLSSCKGKREEKALTEEKVNLSEPANDTPVIGPHKASDIKKWALDAELKADENTIKKIEELKSKYTAGEIILGIAVRTKPSYWENVNKEKKLETLSIMNTGFSKVRIKAGLAEDVQMLNSRLYLEDGDGNIIAVSDSEKGGRLL